MSVMAPGRRTAFREWWIARFVHSRTLLRALGRGAPDVGTVTLDRNKVFILPTAHGLVLAAVLLVMLVGSINYNNNLGLTFTFLTSGVMLMSMLHGYRNLAGLSFRVGRVEPVFAGQRAEFSMCIVNAGERGRYSLAMHNGRDSRTMVDVAGNTTVCVKLEKPAPRRGMLPLGRVAVETRYPLGMFRAWSYLEPVVFCPVYPQPLRHRSLPDTGEGDGEGSRAHGVGSDDFVGLRAYRPGDSPRQIYWKSVAQGMEPQTKEFSGVSGAELSLRWQDLSAPGVEARLSQMCRWLLDAEISGCRYGMRIPGSHFPPGRGQRHQAQCLQALAEYSAAASLQASR